jgi:hypothetical protein
LIGWRSFGGRCWSRKLRQRRAAALAEDIGICIIGLAAGTGFHVFLLEERIGK